MVELQISIAYIQVEGHPNTAHFFEDMEHYLLDV